MPWNPYDHPRYPESDEFAPKAEGVIIIGRTEKLDEEKSQREIFHELGVTETPDFVHILQAPRFPSLSEREKFVALGLRHEASVRRLWIVRLADAAAVEAAKQSEPVSRPKSLAPALQPKPSPSPKPLTPQQSPVSNPKQPNFPKDSQPQYAEKELEEAQRFVYEHFEQLARLEKLNNEGRSEEADQAYQKTKAVGLNNQRLGISRAIDDWENTSEARELNRKWLLELNYQYVMSFFSVRKKMEVVFESERERGRAMQKYIDRHKNMPTASFKP